MKLQNSQYAVRVLNPERPENESEIFLPDCVVACTVFTRSNGFLMRATMGKKML